MSKSAWLNSKYLTYRKTCNDLSDAIWEDAELKFQEFKSSQRLIQALQVNGFDVEEGLAGIETAFLGRFKVGDGGLRIGILGEFDALSGLSQLAGETDRKALIEGGSGHGCGHNILGSAALGAALLIKDYLEENRIPGEVIYYGCPGEEGGSGKAFMAKAGCFDELDMALTWHPGNHNGVLSMTSLANYQVVFHFEGKGAHAAACPHLGRSALDAVELMNVGVNYLREHMPPAARVHYAMVDGGGLSPNVVQPKASVRYLVRAPHLDEVKTLYERVVKIASGAALMTETQMHVVFEKACSNYFPNNAIESVLYEAFTEVGAPDFSAEDMAFAKDMQKTFSEEDMAADFEMACGFVGPTVELEETYMDLSLSTQVLPFTKHTLTLHGSTDVGDVCQVVPTGQIYVAASALGTPGHSWQLVSQGKTEIAHKGLETAAKVLARTAIRYFDNPALIAAAKAEWTKRTKGKQYVSPIPDGTNPTF